MGNGVAAAAVGIIAATLVQLALAVRPRVGSPVSALALAAAALVAVFAVRRSWAAPAIIATGGVAGWAVLP